MISSLWHESAHHSALRQEKKKRVAEGMLEVESLYSLISTGTERLVAKGEVPDSARQAMKVPYMRGDFSFPVKYGYSLVGEVTTAGPYKGKMVHILHPHQSGCLVDETAVFVIPEGVPAKRATLASNLETVVNAIWDAGLNVGDKVLVAGFGMIGALLSRVIAMIPAVDLVVLEKDEKKRLLGKSMGFDIVEDISMQEFDLAFNTTSSGAALQQCIESVGREGKVVELSWYGTKEVVLHLGGDFHYQRKQIISSQVSQIPASRRARWDYKRRKETVFKLLQSSDFDQHISDVIAFDHAPAFFKQLRSGTFEGLGCCLKY
ncbi:MAG: zinc-binding alcohol dehydrogenase [Saprospiraceae bacterium]|nr:zinc-binding alcohol dehydrogenase [Saprospiraceae bacterium]MCB9326347.1 zinc-binding alcohol dehydrogenase [Lewinellaceae bacterium]